MRPLTAVSVLAIVLIAGCVGQVPTAVPTAETGSLQIKITDQAQELTSLLVTIDSVEVHRAVGTAPEEKAAGEETAAELINDTADGWLDVVTQPQAVDLIGLRDIKEILGEAELEPGLYTQVRVRVSSAVATIDGVQETLTVPSTVLRFVHPFRIEANKTTSLIVDFYADYAVALIPAGKIFSPVAEIETEFAASPKDEAERVWNDQAEEARRIREQRAAAAEGPGVTITDAPSSIDAGQTFDVYWRIDSPVQRNIQHTAVHYGTSPVAGDLGTDVAPAASGYPDLTPPKAVTIPGTFSDTISTSSVGTVYFRAHAIVDGKHYWSDESSILVTATPKQGQLKEFAIEADDSSFYPDEPLLVNDGDLVRITFKVRTTNVRFGGLDIRSPEFDTGKISPGGEKTVEFVAESDFSFRSYWPDSNVLKATGEVDVE